MNIRDIVDLANARSSGYGLLDDYIDDNEPLSIEETMTQRFQRSFKDAANQYKRQDDEDQGSGEGDYEG